MFRLMAILLLAIFSRPVSAEEPALPMSRAAIQHHLFENLSVGQQNTLMMPQEQALPGRKSPALAALYSLLVPGLGEHYADGYASGKFFSIAEGALWLGYATVDIYGSLQRDDARSFAVAHAAISPAGKDDQFYVDIGNFMNTDEFNEKRLREREPGKLYSASSGFGWQWDSDASRQKFKDTRISADNALNNRKFVVAAIIVNHIASAINAARAAISFNKDQENQLGALQVKAEVLGGLTNAHGVMLRFEKPF